MSWTSSFSLGRNCRVRSAPSSAEDTLGHCSNYENIRLTEKQGNAPPNTTVCAGDDGFPSLQLSRRFVRLAVCRYVIERRGVELVLLAGGSLLPLEGGLPALPVLLGDSGCHVVGELQGKEM